jgi:hypothetical protein
MIGIKKALIVNYTILDLNFNPYYSKFSKINLNRTWKIVSTTGCLTYTRIDRQIIASDELELSLQL